MEIRIGGSLCDSITNIEFDTQENRTYVCDGLGQVMMIESEAQCREVIAALQQIIKAGYFVERM